MKKLLSILLAVTFVLSMVTVVSAADYEEFKYENYMPKSNSDDAAQFMPWTMYYDGQGINFGQDMIKIVKGRAHSGEYSLYINHGAAPAANNNGMEYNYENTEACPTSESDYLLSFWMKADQVNGFTMGTNALSNIITINNNVVSTGISGASVVTGETENGYTNYQISFKMTAASYTQFKMAIADNAVIEDMYLDDIEFFLVDGENKTNKLRVNGWCTGGTFERVRQWPVRKAEYLANIGGGWKEDNFYNSLGIAPAHNFIEVSDDCASDGNKSLHIVWTNRDTDYSGGSAGQRLIFTHGTSIGKSGNVYKVTLDYKWVSGDIDGRPFGIGFNNADSYFVPIKVASDKKNHPNCVDSSNDLLSNWSASCTPVEGAPAGWQRYEFIIPLQRSAKTTLGQLQFRIYNRDLEAYVDNLKVEVKENGEGEWVDCGLGDLSFEAVPSAVGAATFSTESVVAGPITVTKAIPYRTMNITKDALMSVVLYKDGRVFDIQTADASGYTLTKDRSWTPSVTVNVPDDVAEHEYSIKVMVWGRGTGMSALCGADTLLEAAAE